MNNYDLISQGKYKLIDERHPLDWSFNEDKTILVLESCPVEPGECVDTAGVNISRWRQNKGTWALAFVLKDRVYADAFKAFCNRIVQGSYDMCPKNGSEFALTEYIHWINMFKPCKDILQPWKIQGLIGEILALRDVFIRQYGETSALRSWMNKVSGKQDFIQSDCWYEVKTTLEGRDFITVSSLQQLDRDDEGYMLIVTLRKASHQSKNAINLNGISESMINSLKSLNSKSLFSDTLYATGYTHNSEYGNYSFDLVSIKKYEVRPGFPRLRPSDIQNPAIRVNSYDINIKLLNEFEVKLWN